MEVRQADGGVVVAHRAFHRWKRPAQRAVATSRRSSPAYRTVATQAEMRFLRFQAPWADGRNVFALLRRARMARWANIRHRLMDAAVEYGEIVHKLKEGRWKRRAAVISSGKLGCGRVAVEGRK